MYDKSFIDGCLSGEADLEEFDDYVEYWHTHDTGCSLREFLGLTEYEDEELMKSGGYALLRDILRCRMDNVPFEQYSGMSDQDRLLARSWNLDELEKLKNDDRNQR